MFLSAGLIMTPTACFTISRSIASLDDLVDFYLVAGDSVQGILCLRLDEPELWCVDPESWEFDSDSVTWAIFKNFVREVVVTNEEALGVVLD